MMNMLVEDTINRLIGDGNKLKNFHLYDDGRLVVSSVNDAHIIMQFETRCTAVKWLEEHFHKFDYLQREH